MNGILNILKPPGMTSHDVVAYVRKALGIKKVGHTGTLDPGASGVLPICIGKATKIVDYIMNDHKTYICELTLGNITDTYDKYGKFLYAQNKFPVSVSREEFNRVLNRYKGEITQKPPAFSAIKIGGKRSYELARAGKDVDIPTRKVVIYDIEVLKFEPPEIMLKITCSKGTYIRSICYDLGNDLGYGAYMSFLLRTSTGNFHISNSCNLNQIKKDNIGEYLFNIDYALNMNAVHVDESDGDRLRNGNVVKINEMETLENAGLLKVYSGNKFIGIGQVNGSMLKIDKLMV